MGHPCGETIPFDDWAEWVTGAKARHPGSRSQSKDYLGGHVSARKKPEAVEETAEGALLAVPAADDAAVGDSAAGPALDLELDQVAEDTQDDAAEADNQDVSAPSRRGGKGKLAIGAVLALVVAVGAVWIAGALGGSAAAGLPEIVSEPTVVIAALEEGGIACSGAAVSGDVATCNATVAVRIFESPAEAEKWVAALLKDPQTNSAIGWVRHGNVVVAAPLNAAPDISTALGTGSQIY